RGRVPPQRRGPQRHGDDLVRRQRLPRDGYVELRGACLCDGLCHDRPMTMVFEIVGREEELASVEAFIGRAERGASALVLEGEAGIGKSTLWLAGVEQARA